jgi:hypothetical protein
MCSNAAAGVPQPLTGCQQGLLLRLEMCSRSNLSAFREAANCLMPMRMLMGYGRILARVTNRQVLLSSRTGRRKSIAVIRGLPDSVRE